MKVCAVLHCKNSYCLRKTKDSEVVLHSFPISEAVLEQWVKFVNRENLISTESFICSEHFNEDDFESNSNGEKCLKRRATPSRLTNSRRSSKLHSVEAERGSKTPTKDDQKTAAKSKQSDSGNSTSTIEPSAKSPRITPTDKEMKGISAEDSSKQIVEEVKVETNNDKKNQAATSIVMKKQHEILNVLCTKNSLLRETYEELYKTKRDLEHEKKKVQHLHSAITENYIRELDAEYEVEANTKEAFFKKFQHVLTRNQFDVLFDNKNNVMWTPTEVLDAFTFKYLNPRSYQFVLKELKYPLPNSRTLWKISSRITFPNGVSKEILKMLELMAKQRSKEELVTVLAVSEESIKCKYEYDQVEDQIVGPHRTVQIIYARGLIHNWQQMIYCGFDTEIDITTLNYVIEDMTEIGYNIVGLVSNYLIGDELLCDRFNLTETQHYIRHPCKREEKIYVFPDSTNLANLLRSWIFKSGFIIDNGDIFSVKTVTSLIKNHNGPLPAGAKELAEPLAAELFSRTIAAVFRSNSSVKQFADLIEITTQWYDVMNGRNLERIPLQQRNEILDQMCHELGKMRHNIQSDTLEICQKAFLISINSLRAIQDDISKKFKVSYISPYKLNCDIVRIVFDQIKEKAPRKELTTCRIKSAVQKAILKRLTTYGTYTRIPDPERDQFLNQQLIRRPKRKRLINDHDQLVDECRKENPFDENSFKYLVGWIAKKYQSTHSILVDREFQNTPIEFCYNVTQTDHVKHLSSEIICPSNWWLVEAEKLEKAFIGLHKNGFKKKCIQRSLIKEVYHEHSHLSKEILKAYFKERIIIEVKSFNAHVTENS